MNPKCYTYGYKSIIRLTSSSNGRYGIILCVLTEVQIDQTLKHMTLIEYLCNTYIYLHFEYLFIHFKTKCSTDSRYNRNKNLYSLFIYISLFKYTLYKISMSYNMNYKVSYFELSSYLTMLYLIMSLKLSCLINLIFL